MRIIMNTSKNFISNLSMNPLFEVFIFPIFILSIKCGNPTYFVGGADPNNISQEQLNKYPINEQVEFKLNNGDSLSLANKIKMRIFE